MGKKGGSQTQTTENKPPAWAAPLFQKSASEAMDLYNSGKGGNVYQGQTVADLGANTQAGIGSVMNGGADYGALRDQAGQPTSAQSNLQDYASGKYLKEGNPYYRERLNNEISSANDLIQSQFAGSGRYGSGANTDVLGKNTTNMLLQGLESDYNRAMDNQFKAVGAIDAANAQSIQNQLGVDAAQLGRGQAQIGAGQLQDKNAQDKLQADYAKWQAEDMQDWTRLGLLQSAAAGSAGNYGTNVQTVNQPSNPLGAIGAIGSLFAKSDARLKEHIVQTGTYENGLPMYEFNYRGEPTRFRGLMAHDVADKYPDAVVLEDDGYLAVNYDALGINMEVVAHV